MMEPPVSTPLHPLGIERVIVRRVDEAEAGEDEDQDGGDFEQDHDVVGLRRLANAADEHDREEHDDKNAGMLKPKCQPGCVEIILPARSCMPVGRYAGEIHCRDGCRPNQSSRSTRCAEKPTLTAMLLNAYSRIRSQPMIHATSSPIVA